jgi:hypothetical protein
MCSGGGRQQWRKQRQRMGRQQSTKKWQQRCSKYYFKCYILNITQLQQKEQGAAVCAMVSAANSGKHEGRQQWSKQRQRKGRQQSTKKR